MKKIFALLLLATFFVGAAYTFKDKAPVKDEGVHWMEDFEAAKAKAKKEKKYMILDFTGSDWCGWCIRLDREVFEKQAYIDFAKKNLVSVKLDFPRRKAQSKELKAQNEMLAKKYNVRGFPTILILDSNGKKVGQTGYQSGGPKKYVEHLKRFMK